MLAAWELLGGLSGLLRLSAGALIAFGIFSVWNSLVENPRISEAARRDYVAIAELEAERAKRLEAERQMSAGAIAFEEYRKRLAAIQMAEADEDARHEKEIAEYEARLATAGRACPLTEEDIRELVR